MSSTVLSRGLDSSWMAGTEPDDQPGAPNRAPTGWSGPVVPVVHQGHCEADMSKGQGGGSKSGGSKGGGGATKSGGGQQGAGWPSKTGQPSGGGRDNAGSKK